MSTETAAQTVTLQPPAGLVVPNPQGPGNPPLFFLFTEDWLQLQTFIVRTMQLPTTSGDFEATYGTFTDQPQATGCLAAMQALQGLGTSFGDPATLMAQLASEPTILQTETPPNALYTHIVWYATRLNQAATAFNQTLSTFMEMLNPANCGDPNSCLVMLQELLTGPEGLQSMARDQIAKANVLVQAMEAFNGKLEPAIDTMGSYASPSGAFYPQVQAAIAADAGAGTESEEQKKILLKMVLDAFDEQMKPAEQAADNVLASLRKAVGIWSDVSDNLAFISQTFTVEQMKNLSLAMQELQLDPAIEDWRNIADAAQAYTQNSLVSNQIQPFGAPLPPA
jgi:hypothetical protein